MKIVAIIPARGGSKGIPRKNIKELYGKPLIAHIIETALRAKDIDRVIVSTEDTEIAKISKRYGAEVPFLRPDRLAKDETPTLPVLQHALRYLEEKESYNPDVVVLLYATSPLVRTQTISKAIGMLTEGDFDSVLSVAEDWGHYWIEEDGSYNRLYPKVLRNRQFIRPLLRENGAIYVCRRELLMKENNIVGGRIGFLKIEKKESVDIDEPLDFEFAEFLIRRRENEKNKDRE